MKLMGGFLLVAAIVLVVGVVGYTSIYRLAGNMENIADRRIPDLQSLATLNMQRMMIRAQTLDVWVVENAAHDKALEAYRRIQNDRRESWNHVDKAMETLKSIPRHTQKGRDLIAQLLLQYQAWRDVYVELDALILKFINSSGNEERAGIYLQYGDAVNRMVPVSDAMGKTFVELTENNTVNTGKIVKENVDHAVFMEMVTLIFMIAGVFLAIGFGYFISRSIIVPIKKCVGLAGFLSQGDLTQTVAIDQSDEAGELAKSMNQMSTNLNQMFRDLSQGVAVLSSSSTELSAISSQMKAGAEQTSEKSNTVAAAAEEMSASMVSVAAASEQASTNIHMVATAAEEMSATINEIAQSAEKGRSVTNDAVKISEKASLKVSELGQAARQIGQVTETIADISDQTNLLALNATIEAARAGQAGKGFAIVAAEIKELAKQTDTATQEIRNRIEGIQNTTHGTVAEIKKITAVINDVNTIVTSIASAIQEQSIATREITKNVNQAAIGIQEVNENVAQSSSVSEEIARNIGDVSQSSKEMSEASNQVNTSAGEMSGLAEQISSMTGKFKTR